MTPQQIIGLLLRLFAVWLALSGLIYLGSIPSILQATHVDGDFVIYGIGAAYFLGAAFLWFMPMWSAHKLLPKTQFDNKMSFDPFEVARVGAALLGLWLFAKALPDLAWILLQSYILQSNASVYSSMLPETKVRFALSAIEIAIALAILFNANTFAKFMVRNTRTPQSSE